MYKQMKKLAKMLGCCEHCVLLISLTTPTTTVLSTATACHGIGDVRPFLRFAPFRSARARHCLITSARSSKDEAWNSSIP